MGSQQHQPDRAEHAARGQIQSAASRLIIMREHLHNSFVGLEGLVDWMLAALIARENVLLLGPPGVAKSELAVRTFELLGLSQAKGRTDLAQGLAEHTSPQEWWDRRWDEERKQKRYFHYLLSRFTQPEELFGPIEISLLRQGLHVRINFGMLTGPGVYGVFLDEIFKASSSILNTLLTLTQERQYFNWGGMMRSEIVMFVGASNELPGGFSSGVYGLGSGAEDFQTLYAFIDRFPIRLLVPTMSGTSTSLPEESDLARATKMAIGREITRFRTGAGFPMDRAGMPSIDDLLLLGRACLERPGDMAEIFDREELEKFWLAFIHTATTLQSRSRRDGMITWTISPRKLKALYKIALAHALVRDRSFAHDAALISTLGEEDLHVFDYIWDSGMARNELLSYVEAEIRRFY